MIPEAFHFLRPLWLLALPLALLAPWAWRWRRRRADAWRAVCDPALLAHLRGSAPASSLPPLLLGLAWVLGVLAMAGPAWRELPQALLERDAARVIALELSPEMRATDLAPDRLTRARFAIADLLAARGDGQHALVAYANDAYTVAPVTRDAGTLLALLEPLAPDLMPEPGRRPSRAIRHAVELIERAGHAGGEVLLVASGADPAAVDAARAARAAGVRVSVLAVGTRAGAPVPRADGGFLRAPDGSIALPRLDHEALEAVAAAGGGRYGALAEGQPQALSAFLDGPLPGGSLREGEGSRRSYVDEGPWLLLGLLPLALLGLRRGALALLAIALIAPVEAPLAAGTLWQRADQQAWEALAKGDPEAAAALAEDPALRGSALYRQGDFAAAAEAFAAGDDARAHYNRGTALARAGRYEEALEALDAALARDPGDEDAQANRDAIAEWLAQQQPQPQPQDPSGKDGDQQQSQGQQGSPDQSQQGDGEPQQGEGGEQGPQDGSGDEAGADAGGEPGEQRDRRGEAGEGAQGEGEDAPSGDEASAAPDADQQQAFEEAMARALAGEAGGEAGEEEAAAGAVDPESLREAEQQQMIEQWLRRVPDDPGGLLRRKFAVEHRRRQNEGQEEP